MRKALVVYGGWEGHDPEGVSNLLAAVLRANKVEVVRTQDLDVLAQADLKQFDLIVPVWTMEFLAPDKLQPLLEAVKSGVGIAGLHGLIDSFRHEAEFHLMFGGQWVTHFDFAVRTYSVYMDGEPSPITAGLPDLTVTTEQYYLLIDPANTILATMRVDDTVMPVAWTKRYGAGRVFYCSLGHNMATLQPPDTLELVKRGMLWAAGGDFTGSP
jgi:type 1 glutamine amidotransferase